MGTSVELSLVNELLAQRLAVLPPQSFAAYAVVYLKFFSKNADVREAVAKLVQARIDSVGLDSVPPDLKRTLSRAFSKGK